MLSKIICDRKQDSLLMSFWLISRMFCQMEAVLIKLFQTGGRIFLPIWPSILLQELRICFMYCQWIWFIIGDISVSFWTFSIDLTPNEIEEEKEIFKTIWVLMVMQLRKSTFDEWWCVKQFCNVLKNGNIKVYFVQFHASNIGTHRLQFKFD